MLLKTAQTLIATTLFLTSVYAVADTKAVIKTNMGEIEVRLYDQKAPKTVANFVDYATSDFYNGTIFHRVIPNFMVQGGGFETGMLKKPTKPPIINEAQSFIPNKRGTLAMARTNDPDSATSQFFINVVNNNFLNKNSAQAGYAVFGEVEKGMDIVDAIASTKTGRKGPYGDVPVQDIIIQSVTIEGSATE